MKGIHNFFIYLFGILFPVGLGSLVYIVWANVTTPALSEIINLKTNNGKSEFVYHMRNMKWVLKEVTYCEGDCGLKGGGGSSGWGGGGFGGGGK